MTVHLKGGGGTSNVPRPKNNRETESIRRMIHARLQRHEFEDAPVGSTPAGAHLDEDALATFVEGRLGENESAPLIRHLVACGFCRRITAQLIRLDDELGALNETVQRTEVEDEPGRLRRFLADLAARVLPSSETDAVFAYHAPAEDFQRPTDAETSRESDAVETSDTETPEERDPGHKSQ
ncbi:MAG: hypothetical protein QOD00_2240 [Blastocatellia bacterium]|nr:hypothetical protein [Blastocatellia bacterium]